MKAMILAAGRGERMRPLTDSCPKPLLCVGGKPLIVWHIERLARAGIEEIVINHAHLGHMFENVLSKGQELGVRIAYSPEAEALETAGGIANALPLLGAAPFLVVNGDVYCELNYATFIARALTLMAQGQLGHINLVNNPPHHPDGDFSLDASGMVSEEGGFPLTYSGIGAFRPELFAGIVPGEKVRLAPLLRHAIAQKRLSGEYFHGYWEDVGTPERLERLDSELKNLPPKF
jgi:N-acetyl-alpha-D-muramate 1-phosphate uridylyltransferase